MSMLEKAGKNDPDAWRKLVHLYTPLLARWIRKCGIKNDQIENLMQIVFTKMVQNLDKFQKTDPNHKFRKWLKTICSNAICDHFRNAGNRHELAIGGNAHLLDQLAQTEVMAEDDDEVSQEVGMLYWRAMEIIEDKHSKKYVDAFVAYVLHDHLPIHVAEQLQISIETVYKAKSMVLKTLRSEFADFFM